MQLEYKQKSVTTEKPHKINSISIVQSDERILPLAALLTSIL